MKLSALHLRNFKGIKKLDFEADGQDAAIYGKNETGKTTLNDAFLWLLFRKDSLNRADFEIKELNAAGQVKQHGLNHEVEGVITHNGNTITLKRVYSEKWTRKRGETQKEMTGHTTAYFLDDVPVKKKEYDAYIADICSEETFRLLTDPRYFNEHLHWTKRREILLSAFGDVSDQEVIESDSKLKDLPEILGNHTLDELRKIISERQKNINKELERIPVRIDEVMRGLPDISDINQMAIEKNIKALKGFIQEKQEEKARIESGGQVAEKTKQLREMEADYLAKTNKVRQAINEAINANRSLHSKVNRQSVDITAEIEAFNGQILANNHNIEVFENELPQLREQWNKINAEALDLDVETVCPACGQDLPADQVEAAKEKALSQFNEKKAARLDEINKHGKSKKEEMEVLKNDITAFESQIKDLASQLAKIDADKEAMDREFDELRKSDTEAFSPEKDPNIAKLKDEIKEIISNNADQIGAAQEEINALEDQKKDNEALLADIKSHKNGQVRIKELSEDEKRLASEFERLGRELHLTEEFIRTKVNILESRINSQFKITKFKLFDVQVNGALNEVCEAMVNGVPYTSNLNNGNRIKCGLDCINTLSNVYEFSPPVFVDNAESITDMTEIDAQVISLIVSAKDKKLRIEINNKAAAKAA